MFHIHIAALDPLSGVRLDWDPRPRGSLELEMNGFVYEIELEDSRAWLGGHFSEVLDEVRAGAAVVSSLEPAAPVVGDVDGDGVVGFSDLLAVLSAWGPCPAPPEPCPTDVSGDGTVGFGDLLIVLTHWS